MKNLGYYNGRIGLIEDMMIPMNDRVCWFGDGVYDAGPCRNYHIFAIDEHIERFYRSAAALDIRMPMGKSDMKALLNELVKKVDTGDLFVYGQVTRGTAMRSHDYEDLTGNLWIVLRPSTQEHFDKPIRMITVEDTRYFHCNIKTLNLIPNVMASQKAKLANCHEAVFYRPGGWVTECAHSNVHIFRNGILYTHPADNLILPGIARAHLIRKWKELGHEVREEAFTIDDLFAAEEILVTDSSNLVRFAEEIDGKKVGGKQPLLRKEIHEALLKEYLAATD